MKRMVLGVMLLLMLCAAYPMHLNTRAEGAQLPAAMAGCGAGLGTIDTVKRFYALIDARQFDLAFQCYSAHEQSQFNFQTWRQNYRTSLHSALAGAPIQQDPTTVRFTLLATDGVGGHRVYTSFSGTWYLVTERGGWRLDRAGIAVVARKVGPSLVFSDALLAMARRLVPGTTVQLPANLALAPAHLLWEVIPAQPGARIILGSGGTQSTPQETTPQSGLLAEANTVFTEIITPGYDSANQPTQVDGQVTLANGAIAYFFVPDNHGANGRPDLTWSQEGIGYYLDYACGKSCLPTLAGLANSLVPAL